MRCHLCAMCGWAIQASMSIMRQIECCMMPSMCVACDRSTPYPPPPVCRVDLRMRDSEYR
eukprot:15460812-Alexandrium_andersonii.AAC.1